VGNRILTDRACTNDQRDLLPGPRGNLGTPATHTTPPGSTCSPRTTGRTPRGQPRPRLDRSTAACPKAAHLWLGIRKVGREDPAAVLAALAEPSWPDARSACASDPQTLARIWHRGPPGAVYSRCRPDAWVQHGLPREPWTVTAATTYAQARAAMSTSVPGSATMHRVTRRCSSVGRAAVL
jgi:hypothetical protein